MPFPLVSGRTAVENIEVIAHYLDRWWVPKRVKRAAADLFVQIDVVSTQLYHDVRGLKREAAVHGWAIMTDDPSQRPIP